MDNLLQQKPTHIEIEIGDLLLSIYDANLPKDTKKLAPHFHSTFEFQYAYGNDYVLKTPIKTYHIEKYSYVLIPPHCFHWTEYQNEDIIRYSYFFSISVLNKDSKTFSEYEYYKALFKQFDQIINLKNDIVSNCLEHIVTLVAEQSERNMHKIKIFISRLFLAITKDINTEKELTVSTLDSVKDLPAEKKKLQSEISEYISVHYAQENLMENIALLLHMSQRNVSRIINELFGVPLSVLILNQRMNCAWGFIIETDHSLYEISEMIGYNSYNAFYRAFKTYYGISPNHLREYHTQNNNQS